MEVAPLVDSIARICTTPGKNPSFASRDTDRLSWLPSTTLSADSGSEQNTELRSSRLGVRIGTDQIPRSRRKSPPPAMKIAPLPNNGLLHQDGVYAQLLRQGPGVLFRVIAGSGVLYTALVGVDLPPVGETDRGVVALQVERVRDDQDRNGSISFQRCLMRDICLRSSLRTGPVPSAASTGLSVVGCVRVGANVSTGGGGPDFIREIVEDDLRTGRHSGRVVTRFPPEPNGYLHIGHAKAICLNFGLADEYGGQCYLRFDDTNPLTEAVEYVESIVRDVTWLGFSFGDGPLYASDYFDEMYELAEALVLAGEAYVDDLSEEEIRDYRGSLTEPGRPSPHRRRSVEDNLELLQHMRAGELPDGSCVLRAKIDLGAANMKMRDPLLYRIRHAHHHRTGNAWPIYPLYDWAHPISDAIEGVTHSLCTLEFENNRELYDWVIERTGVAERRGFSRPQQYEFARLNLDYTVLSKRRLLALVEEGHVDGWDDPQDADDRRHSPPGHQSSSRAGLCRPRGRRQGQLDSRHRQAGFLRTGRPQLDGPSCAGGSPTRSR